MFERIIRFAIEQRIVVMIAVLIMAGIGIYSYQKLPIDAVPDITNVQVQINTGAPGYSPLETEQRITFPVETAMAGLPGLQQTRSLSRSGLSQVTVIFKDGTDIFFARQLINERLQVAKEQLPDGVEAVMGPVSTGLGEIFLWTVEAEDGALKEDGTPYTPTDLRVIQDWIIKPQLRNVPGVAEINTIGGFAKQFLIAPDPKRLATYKLTLNDLVVALESNNANVGAGYIERNGEQLLIRAPGQVSNIEDIANIVITSVDGTPIRISNVAEVSIGKELRTGAATENGREVVLGTVFMLIGENSRTVSQAVATKLTDINRTLPKGVVAVTVYDRTNLVEKAIATVKKNLVEGAILVIAILFLFLGNIRAALITAMVIPLSMLFTFTGMFNNKVSANLMSLGALDFGIIVDGAVVIVENAIRRLAHAQHKHGRILTKAERFHEVFAAAGEARRPLIFGQLIIMVVYLPIFALTGVEGKMFHPMAFTVVMALLGAMILSVTFVPAAIAMFITGKVKEEEGVVMRTARQRYEPILQWVLGHRNIAFSAAVALVVLSGILASRMGSEFIPSLSEGDFAMQAMRVPGTSLTQSVEMQQRLEKAVIAQVPEVERMFARSGTAEIASDPMPPNASDAYIMLKPQDQWPNPNKPRDELIAEVQKAAAGVPGSNYELSQPIQLRFNELISGVRSDVAVKVFGDDMDALNSTANKIAASLKAVPGSSEVKVEQTSGLPVLTINIDREKAARYGLNIADVQNSIAIAVGGRQAGTLYEGDRRFDMVVRLPETVRTDVAGMSSLLIPVPANVAQDANQIGFIPLSQVANLDLQLGPNQISRENGKRLVVVSANVRGRDLGSFVEEATKSLATVQIPAGYWTTWGGQFEQLQSAAKRLQIVVPVALLLVMTLLFLMFNNLKDGMLVFTGIPFALTGGVVALWLRDIPLSISAGVGFIALSGVAVLNGLVMISFIRGLREEGRTLRQAVDEGALTRLRPVLMTALVASLGFIPMALATGTGAEVQRPLATVVIGGILSSTVLTLLVLPALYQWAHRKDDDGDEAGS
ncbi:MAG: cation transporter [Pseudomonadales bacterium RIFCSPLOWO2_12_60_38]|jgi:cobalt-zinc-cadmium resistance protein CzcA|uniref:CusA/CzcA family heavy metal efflux RND transporter n=9 Tax=Gammaproteobacteria TaxID=1236 RepID=A0A7Y0ZZW6_PSEVE|nr:MULTISPECIES: CusA/CzcA family heavy metal efflux RND transporter [Pseudomonas]OHC35799.1 MAG: cation transporter [Pseudomonadales bacterium RIFCSPLOWO2_12_60_38]OHC37585.1 MAG: cation transporter [Pseudomonadales bacterium RIFCSPLOWO2_12_FULL_59_450]AHC33514.1 cation transporter [Pseudomonas sp. TKP]ATN08869.1 CusA/CzcA family heavy metal efflux RND transporter [Pseudomonas sp. FDAARGOS_380]AZE65074.1 Cobalt-zinc-cadmium resistance protein CzcA [Pseudomonas synxantha]|eukprot:gene6851-7962_t